MSRQPMRYLMAGLFREWTRTRASMMGLWLVAVGGPLINLVNTIAQSGAIRVNALFQSIYMAQVPGNPLDYVHRQLVQDNFPYSPVPFHIVGYPILSLWMIAIAMLMGAGLVTMDKHLSSMADVLSFPFPQRSFILSKTIWGLAWLLIMGFSRTILIGALSMLSPWHVTVSTIVWSLLLNVLVAWAVFSVSLWLSTGVRHVLVAWSTAFLGLTLPLTLGAVIRFVGSIHGLSKWSYRIEHQFMLKLSPFWFTDYNTLWVQHFLHKPKVGELPLHLKLTSMTMFTAVSHPWVILVVSIGLSALCVWLSVLAFVRLPVESSMEWFGSRGWFHCTLALASITFGSIGTQIINHKLLALFVVLSAACYSGLWGMAVTVKRRWVSRPAKQPTLN